MPSLLSLDAQDQNGLKVRPQGWSLLHLVCAVGQTESAAMLLKHGADVQGMPCHAFIACSHQQDDIFSHCIILCILLQHVT